MPSTKLGRKHWLAAGAIVLVLGAAMAIGEYRTYLRGVDERNVQKTKDQLVIDCRGSVKAHLRTATGAQFPVWDQVSMLDGASDAKVYGEVSSPNSGGVMAKQQYMCTAAKADGRWTITSVVLG